MRTWLCSILRFKLMDHFRRLKREVPLDEPEQHFDRLGKWKTPPKSPEQGFQAMLAMQVLELCLSGLAERQRQLFLLAEVEGFSPQELAESSGLASGNVRVLLHRARLKLRQCLTDGGVEL